MAYGCTSLPWVTKWGFFQDEQSHFPSLGPTFWKTPPLKISHTTRSGRSAHTGWHGTATHRYQPFPDLW